MALSDLQKDELERLILNREEARRQRQTLRDEIKLLEETLLNIGGLTLSEVQSIWGLTEEAAQKILDRVENGSDQGTGSGGRA